MINHLSQSSIDQFLRCSWQWKLQRVDKLPTGTSWQMLAGGIVHEVAAWNFLHKVERKIDMPKAQLLEHAKKISRTKIDEVPRWHTKDLDEDLERMRTRVEVCTGLFADSVAPFIQPIEGGIEKKLKIPAGQGFPDILCFLDCIDGNNVIHDFKTTNKAPGVNYVSCEVHHEIQPSAYGLAFRIAFGRDPAEFRFHYMVETAHPKVVPCATRRTANSYIAFLRRAQQVWAAHKAGAYLPAPKGWWCSEDHCYFAAKNQCEFYQRYH